MFWNTIFLHKIVLEYEVENHYLFSESKYFLFLNTIWLIVILCFSFYILNIRSAFNLCPHFSAKLYL